METLTLDVPAMFGDHHVIDVRRLLFALPGVQDVYASSSFHIVEIQFDADAVSPAAIKGELEAAGYLDDLPVPEETDVPANEATNGEKPFFRHTAAYVQTGKTVSFAQNLPAAGRPLWPCPGMGPVAVMAEEEETSG